MELAGNTEIQQRLDVMLFTSKTLKNSIQIKRQRIGSLKRVDVLKKKLKTSLAVKDEPSHLQDM